MNWLIIHNDNLTFDLMDSLKNDNQTVFKLDISPANQSTPSYVFDGELHSLLTDCFYGKHNYDVIFIPYNLSKENYLEFTGVRTALHIRLTKDWNNTKTPIVFYGCDPLVQVAKITKNPKILFSKSSYHVLEENIDKFHNIALQVERLDNASWIDLVLNLDLTPSAKYRTHHDIANEYALFKWSKDIGCLDTIPSLKYQFGTRPYFKLLEIKSEIEYQEKKKISSKLKCETETNILLIDDQANEGWAHFYTALFLNQSKINFKVFDILDSEGEIKKIRQESQESIINNVREHILKLPEIKKPDIILLDLRLCSVDFRSDSKPVDLTGIKLVEQIRKYFNKGIQIIITSASDKIWNYTELVSRGINGYIIKSTIEQYDSNAIESIVKLINKLIPRALFLKAIDSKNNLLLQNVCRIDESLNLNSQNQIQVAFKLVQESYELEKYRNFAYIQYFQLMETFLKSEKVIKEESDCINIVTTKGPILVRCRVPNPKNNKFKVAYSYNRDERKYELKERVIEQNKKYIETNEKMALLLAFKFGIVSTDKLFQSWSKINTVRNNKAVHGNNIRQGLISNQEIHNLIDFFLFITNLENENDKYHKKELTGLTVKDKDSTKYEDKKKQKD